jgi:hypothetical protein
MPSPVQTAGKRWRKPSSETWSSHKWDEPEITVDNIGDERCTAYRLTVSALRWFTIYSTVSFCLQKPAVDPHLLPSKLSVIGSL